MRKRTRLAIPVVSFFLSLFLTGIGFSKWSIQGVTASFSLKHDNRNEGKEVAYYTDANKKKHSFTTIEGALASAGADSQGNTVYVIPGTNPTIYKSCTVKSGDTLCLPYEGETYNGRQRNAQSGGTSNNSWKTPVTFDNDGVPVSGDFIPMTNYKNPNPPFADANAAFVKYFKKNEVTLNPNCTITIEKNARLNIGGILGWDGQRVSGQTSGKYAQITRKKGSSIINKGTIDCRGYIKEENKQTKSKLQNESGSVLYMPFVFYDYKGGKFTASVYGSDTKIFPLYQYDFPNIQSEMVFKHTSKLIGYVDLYTQEQQKTVPIELTKEYTMKIYATIAARHNTDDLNLIGPSGSDTYLFETKDSNSTITITRSPNDYLYSNYLRDKGAIGTTILSFKENCGFNQTSISIDAGKDLSIHDNSDTFPFLLKWLVKLASETAKLFTTNIKKRLNQEVKTSEVYFPLPWNRTLNVESGGSLELSQARKLMPGANIVVANGGKLNVTNKCIVYDDSLDSKQFVYPTDRTISPYPDKGAAKRINNGTRTIKSTGSFGGRVSTETTSAKLIIETGAVTDNLQSHEGDGNFDINGTDVTFNFTDFNNSPVTKSAAGILVKKTTDSAGNEKIEKAGEQKLSAGKTYVSYQISSSNEYGWLRQ